jgi:hypothetical protein
MKIPYFEGMPLKDWNFFCVQWLCFIDNGFRSILVNGLCDIICNVSSFLEPAYYWARSIMQNIRYLMGKGVNALEIRYLDQNFKNPR